MRMQFCETIQFVFWERFALLSCLNFLHHHQIKLFWERFSVQFFALNFCIVIRKTVFENNSCLQFLHEFCAISSKMSVEFELWERILLQFCMTYFAISWIFVYRSKFCSTWICGFLFCACARMFDEIVSICWFK